ncbi:unnamed protein product [Tuber aestivum]|uniref:Uncharacterized protein n=1 Tax=Tuber aestivum TaxID=59557 RepID=A0A292Q437_9PEZI|nr:unnamed protein product [Tuber aestivum]
MVSPEQSHHPNETKASDPWCNLVKAAAQAAASVLHIHIVSAVPIMASGGGGLGTYSTAQFDHLHPMHTKPTESKQAITVHKPVISPTIKSRSRSAIEAQYRMIPPGANRRRREDRQTQVVFPPSPPFRHDEYLFKRSAPRSLPPHAGVMI